MPAVDPSVAPSVAPLEAAWPLFQLRIRSEHLVLRLPLDEDLPDLLALAKAGIHPPDEMPFGVAWTDDHLRRDPVEGGIAGVQRTGQGRVVGIQAGLAQGDDAVVVGARAHHSSRERPRIAATSSSVTSRGAVASRRCCFIAPSTRSSTSSSP